PRGKLKPLLDLGYSRGEAMAFFDPYHGTPDGIPAETMKAAEQAAGDATMEPDTPTDKFAVDIPRDAFVRAFSGTSHSPEKRAASAMAEFRQQLESDYNSLAKH